MHFYRSRCRHETPFPRQPRKHTSNASIFAQTLKPLDLLRPRAFSNLRPLLMTRGFLCECGPKPKCLTASRAFLGPRSSSVFAPVGARLTDQPLASQCTKERLTTASSSSVRHSPPALTRRARAVRVNRSAATVIFGTSTKLLPQPNQQHLRTHCKIHSPHIVRDGPNDDNRLGLLLFPLGLAQLRDARETHRGACVSTAKV
jgi:hypothetical protein